MRYAGRWSRSRKALGLMRGIPRKLRAAAEAELVMVLVLLAAPRTNDHPRLQTPLWMPGPMGARGLSGCSGGYGARVFPVKQAPGKSASLHES